MLRYGGLGNGQVLDNVSRDAAGVGDQEFHYLKARRIPQGFEHGHQPLLLVHGFPLRVVIPRLLGYKNAKYVERIELTNHAVYGYWVSAGYPYDGEVNPDRLRPGKY